MCGRASTQQLDLNNCYTSWTFCDVVGNKSVNTCKPECKPKTKTQRHNKGVGCLLKNRAKIREVKNLLMMHIENSHRKINK